jgi:hypothetical protein
MVGFILFLVSLISLIFIFITYPYGVIKSLFKGEFGKYHNDIAVAIDQLQNVIGKYFLNDTFITKKAVPLGLRMKQYLHGWVRIKRREH